MECSTNGAVIQRAKNCARKAHEGPGRKGAILFIDLWGRKVTVDLNGVSLGQLDIRCNRRWNGQ